MYKFFHLSDFYVKSTYYFRSQILEDVNDLDGRTTASSRFCVHGLFPIWKNFTYHVYHRKGFLRKVPIGNIFFYLENTAFSRSL